MKGLELSESYYNAFGRDMIHSLFPGYESSVAVGLIGEGSECFGYDDEISRDHDFDAGFIMFLTNDAYDAIGFPLSRAYDKLPREFNGVKLIGKSAYGSARHGVHRADDFFMNTAGCLYAPENPADWLNIPSYALSELTNGKIFRDESGDFSRRRSAFNNMPEDARLKKIAAEAILMAQTGQYNYTRCILHGERACAVYALSLFARHTCEMVFLLNRRYCPYYKWMFRGAGELTLLSSAAKAAERLLLTPLAPCVPDGIEEICAQVISELRSQKLTDADGNYLEPHAFSIQSRISDVTLRNMHIMDGAAE